MKVRIGVAFGFFLIGIIFIIPYFPHREALERYASQGKVVTAVVTDKSVKKTRKTSTPMLCFSFPRDGKQVSACSQEYIDESDYTRLPVGAKAEIIYLPDADRSPVLKSSVDDRLSSPPYGQFGAGFGMMLAGVAAFFLIGRQKQA